ncbi:MAG: helix-hairpin-helix domain-containing protein [Bacteroidales bacterium]
MNPNKVIRSSTRRLTDLPNIGPAMASDLELLGIHSPKDLEGRDPFDLYELLCLKTHSRQDPCVLDTFMSITDFMRGNEPRPWWDYTEERKRRYDRQLKGMIPGMGRTHLKVVKVKRNI